ncbi:hypothetical protein CsSME_00013561 [Camellia sinensis var. sinensis]
MASLFLILLLNSLLDHLLHCLKDSSLNCKLYQWMRKAVADGDTITMYVSTMDPRESSSVPIDVQIAAVERSKARAGKNYATAEDGGPKPCVSSNPRPRGRIGESAGEGVTDLAPGDHVLPVFTGECKECAHCKSEESNMCDPLRINTDRGVMIHDQKSRFSIKGKPIFHFVGTSTFSEYTVVHVGCCTAEANC